MKKSILSIVMLLVVATATNAAPRFGIIGEQDRGVGAFITDDMYNAQVTFGSDSQDLGTQYDTSAISIGANYKVALDSVTALTAGVSYRLISGSFESVGVKTAIDHDGSNSLAINLGFERALSKNLILTTQAAAYTTTTITPETGTEIKETALFSDGRVGVAYLF